MSDEVDRLVRQARQGGDPVGWFEPLYAAADGDAGRIPWARQAPHPAVLDWLETHPGAGTKALVVGCGLGDDAAAAARAGYDVTAFDISSTAVTWAQRRFDALDIDWHVTDLRATPGEWIDRFGLVVEVRTIQSLPEAHQSAMAAVASHVAPAGTLLLVALVARDARIAREWNGPPWALDPAHLATFTELGLEQVDDLQVDHARGGAAEHRLVYRRPD